MQYGRTVQDGFLPVFSVADEEEARHLLTLACPTNLKGQFIAPQLAREQTIANLLAFSDHLDEAHEWMRERGNCRCQEA